ncbi:PAS domain-containing protein [Streptomyces thermolilacinus]
MDSGDAPRAVPGRGPEEGRVPLAVATVDHAGRISHWSAGARRLFGPSREDAVGRPAVDLLPLSGVLPDDGHDGHDGHDAYDGHGAYGRYGEEGGHDACAPYDRGLAYGDEPTYRDGPGHGPDRATHRTFPVSGRARLPGPGAGRADVLWWAYPLDGPGGERLLVLAADASPYGGGDGEDVPRVVAPGFAPHTEPGYADELTRRLPGILPGMSLHEAAGIASRVCELGQPVLEFISRTRVPVSLDRACPHAPPTASARRAGAGGPAD